MTDKALIPLCKEMALDFQTFKAAVNYTMEQWKLFHLQEKGVVYWLTFPGTNPDCLRSTDEHTKNQDMIFCMFIIPYKRFWQIYNQSILNKNNYYGKNYNPCYR